MRHFIGVYTVFIMTFSLALTSCGGSSDGDDNVNPFSEGELLTALEGDWFDSKCEQNFNEETSSLVQMDFKFDQPFSWRNDLFKENSLEFSGSLKIEKVKYNNSFCLGTGSRTENLIESNVAINNLSVIRGSVKSNSFRAYYAQEKKFDFDRQIDVGAGILFEFERTDGKFAITPLNSFTYQGLNVELQNIASPASSIPYYFTNAENPINKFNIADVRDADLSAFLKSPGSCNKPYILDRTYPVPGGNYNGLLLVMQTDSDRLKLSFVKRESSVFETSLNFQTTNLDWVYIDGQVHTEKKFIFTASGSRIRVQNEGFEIDQELSAEPKSPAELKAFLEERGVSSLIFEDCK